MHTGTDSTTMMNAMSSAGAAAAALTTAASSSPGNNNNDNNNNNNSDDDDLGPGSKRPLNRTDKHGEPLSEKKLRRLEKNRLSARECRRRKREATETLSQQINLLEGENLRLRLQLQIGEEAEATNQQEQQKLTENLDALLRSGASESEIYAKIEEYKEKFADYGRDRRSAIEFHLRNIERLLQPTQTTSVVLTTLQMGGQSEQVTPGQSETTTQDAPTNTPESTSYSSAPPTTVASSAPHGSLTVKSVTTTQDAPSITPESTTSSSAHPTTVASSAPDGSLTVKSEATTHDAPTIKLESTSSSSAPPTTVASSAPDGSLIVKPEATTHDAPTIKLESAASSSSAPPTTGASSAPDSSLTAKSLFRHFITILDVTPEQSAALKDSRFVAQEMDGCLKASLDVLEELRTRLTQCGEDLETEFNNVRAILTPTQAAKFLVWVANNEACMHMLNELWNKVYPQTTSGEDSGDHSP